MFARRRKKRSLYEEYLLFKSGKVGRIDTQIRPSDILKSSWLKVLVFTLSLTGSSIALIYAPSNIFIPICILLLVVQVIMTKLELYSISDGIAISMSIYTFPVLVISFPMLLAYQAGYGVGIGTAVEKVGMNIPALISLFLINLFSMFTFFYSLGYAFEASVKYGSYIYIITFFSGIIHELGHYLIIPSYGIVIAFPYFMATVPMMENIPIDIYAFGVFAGPLMTAMLIFLFDIIYGYWRWDFALIGKRVNQFLLAINIMPMGGTDGYLLLQITLSGYIFSLFLYLILWILLVVSVVV